MEQSTRPARARRGLGPALTTLLVVDVLLVLAVAVALAVYLSGGAAPGPGAGGTPSSAATSDAEPGEEASPAPDGQPGTFALPSGNISCEVTDDAATCTIAESDAPPATEPGCAGAVGPVVTVTAEGAGTPCLSGALPGTAAPGTPVLDYGESTTIGDFTCTSATTGVTCRHDPSDAGFVLARAGHTLF